ncbi:Argininosuccinate lyase [Candidatus Desulfarcum epimagneticum]|uniref:Argininosuccinate lyase n=1 Tax=uncultured Desulfobacteraceae bacterium TaxID=218296 RepID=A0A484HLS5_9BACT|nr:Argininosuccinate lyase [uncultured Desulfobacteraceae bacterium]
MSGKLWDGRFSEKTGEIMEDFSASIHFDQRLWPHDIKGSLAHCRMLADAGVISKEEFEAISKGLKKIEKELRSGSFKFENRLEDIHMHIESRLFEVAGKPALKLHTARSRNDQVALDIRMWLKDEIMGAARRLLRLQKTIARMARDHMDAILPGYTHLQRAQPVLFSHHLMAYVEMFSRDFDRMMDVYKRTDVMPLGAAALAGTTYPIDRAAVADMLGFSKVSENSMDSVSDRDFTMEFLSAAAICMTHLSRMSEEIILWSSAEFDFIGLPDAFSTGSSIMPQKKNPDAAELVRGKTGRVFGSLTALLTLMKSLPLAYNRDMQEDKEPLFDAADTLKACLNIYIRMLPHMEIKKDHMRAAAQKGFLNATDLADYLAQKGMPFRKAHDCAGRMVAKAISQKKELHEMNLEEMRAFSPLISPDIFEALSLKTMIKRRSSYGGTAPENVSAAVDRALARIEGLLEPHDPGHGNGV